MTIAYPSLPFAQTQPDRMATQAILRGLSPALPSQARVLEIGCADAGNLAALAAYAPAAQFVGVDIDAAAVDRAQAHGLANLQVIRADLSELDLGGFDYVIAHGVYSWLPEPDALLRCLSRHLAVDGLAYVSYDCLPGSHLRMMVGEVLRREAGSDLVRAREVGASILGSLTDSDNAGIMGLAMRRALDKPDHVLAHDELQALHMPVFFSDFVASAAMAGLYFAGESHLADSAHHPGSARDPLEAEQWADYVTNRQFRQTLLSVREPGPVDAAALTQLYVSAPVQRLAPGQYQLLGGVRAEIDDSVLAADLDLLASAWPAAVPGAELRADARAHLRLYAARAVDLRSEPVVAVDPDDRPCVIDYMRGRDLVTTCRHEPLQFEDDLSRRAVALMDGANTRDRIAAELGVSRVDLDHLIEGLGREGLFVRPPAATAC